MKIENLLWKTWEKIPADRVVLIDAIADKNWTAQMLTKESRRFDDALAAYAAGDKIAFRLPNGAEWLALFLALQRAGLVAVPLDGSLPTEGCLETARRLYACALYLEGVFHSLGKTPRSKTKACCIKVTSGSDGLPKAVACRAEHLLADGWQIIRTMKIGPRDRNLAAIPLGHSYGLGNLVMPLILQGTSLVCAAEFVPRQLVDWIGRYRVTVFPAVPALFRVLAALPPGPTLAPLRTAISAGAVLSPEIARAFFERYGVKIHNFYGSSETGGICYDRSGAASLSGRSVGKPLEGVAIFLRDGRIQVKSAAVAKPGGKWLLNDCGEWNQREELVLLGRHGSIANIGGKKVHPLEVERLLRSLPGVTDAGVWMHHRQGRDVLAAGVETTLSQKKLEQVLALRLPSWKMPKSYFIARELPRTARGKLDLAALRAQID
jgi:acyl-CoA synthetase (AMP-forming)/AMP-acid ligase II